MEPFQSYGYIDALGRVVIVSSTQIVFHVRRHIARALGIPATKVRVIKPRIGGGFGSKQTACTEIMTAFVAWTLKKTLLSLIRSYGSTDLLHYTSCS